jgi:hypothetical protein
MGNAHSNYNFIILKSYLIIELLGRYKSIYFDNLYNKNLEAQKKNLLVLISSQTCKIKVMEFWTQKSMFHKEITLCSSTIH